MLTMAHDVLYHELMLYLETHTHRTSFHKDCLYHLNYRDLKCFTEEEEEAWMCSGIELHNQLPTNTYGICVYNYICNKMASANKVSSQKIFQVNRTEIGTVVTKSISWNVRKVSIGCDQRVHLWTTNILPKLYFI